MLRWNSTRCHKPKVVLIDNIPYCTHCDGISSFDLTGQPSGNGKSDVIQSSSLKLQWPTSVTYSKDDDFLQPKLIPVPVKHLHKPQLEQDRIIRYSPKFSGTKRTQISHIKESLQGVDGYCALGQMYDFRLLYFT
jgi:hypothetical protein